MFGIFDKPIKKLTLEDIESLVEDEVSENRNLDYKQEYKFSKDSDKKEFLYDVCSFANSGGGYLIYGIEELKKDGKGTGYPKKVIGLKNFNPDLEIRGFESSILRGIQPRISVKSQPIKCNENDSVLIIEIPRSYNTPHMVTFKDSCKFYNRVSASKYLMNDVGEIRDFFLKANSLPRIMRDFRLDRLNAIKNGDTQPIELGKSFFVLHIFPMDSFLPGHNTLDIKKISENDSLIPIGSNTIDDYQINYDGLCNFSRNWAKTQIYRDGKIEAITLHSMHSEDKEIRSLYEGEFVKSVKNYTEKLESWEIKGPFYVYISLLNIRGFNITIEIPNKDSGGPIDKEDLLLPEIEFSDGNQVSYEKFKYNFDLVWNASGRWGSPNFDSDGNWQGKREF